MENAWKKTKSKVVHKNPWYSVREDDVIRPDGKPGKYYVVDTGGAVAIIAEDDDSIYLVGQSRYATKNYSWEVVLGGIEEEQDVLDAAKQELQEEAGLLANDWIELGYFYPFRSISSEKFYIYLARDLTKTQVSPDPTEDITVKKEKVKDVIKMIKNNKINCGITTAVIYKYLLFKERENKKY